MPHPQLFEAPAPNRKVRFRVTLCADNSVGWRGNCLLLKLHVWSCFRTNIQHVRSLHVGPVLFGHRLGRRVLSHLLSIGHPT